MSTPEIETHGNWQYTTAGGKLLKRRVGTTEWRKQDTPPPPEPSPMELSFVRESQSPGEPDHWSLFLAGEGQQGSVFQVRGDAIAMYYAHDINVDQLHSLTFKDSYIIARPTEEQAARVQYWATHEVPPSAPNQAAVQENCQGLSVRVMKRLVAEGIMEQRWVDSAMGLQEPVC